MTHVAHNNFLEGKGIRKPKRLRTTDIRKYVSSHLY